MCGICGTYGFSQPLVDEYVLKKMTNTLTHRGPDDTGLFLKGNVGLGHTRLSIIDLSTAGHQPMQSSDASVTLIYNGELYNYQELKKSLIKKEGLLEVILIRKWFYNLILSGVQIFFQNLKECSH